MILRCMHYICDGKYSWIKAGGGDLLLGHRIQQLKFLIPGRKVLHHVNG